jgi:peptidoglycan/LPS O-acetylase OafA/YrhL
LWTIPFELECYICLTVIAFLGLQTRRLLLLAGLIFLIAVKTYTAARLGDAGQFEAPPGRLLVASFLGGVLAYCYRDRIPYSGRLFAVALLLDLFLTRNAVTAYLAVIPTVYVTVYLGLLNPPKYTFLMRGDYSYGLYLFAFPIQQTYALLFPQHRVWWLSIVFTLCVGLAYAAFSWRAIEKPILRRKNEIIGRLMVAVRPVSRIISSGWRNSDSRLRRFATSVRSKFAAKQSPNS